MDAGFFINSLALMGDHKHIQIIILLKFIDVCRACGPADFAVLAQIILHRC